MHTGYDSFWMYQNSRHEPVLDLPNNDNQSHAVLTDSYKQVQSGGHSSLLNDCIPPQNNIARSQENDRTPHSQYMWPSSVYSIPLKPLYVSNFHPQAPFPAQSNNLGYLPEYSQQNLSDGSDLRNHKNSNPSVSQVLNRNINSTMIRNNQNTSGHSGRIRVRDVFSLNKSSVPNSDSYQNKQYGYYYYNSEYTNKNQSKFVNYGRSSLLPTSHPPPYYASHQITNHPGSGQQFQLSSPPFYQQNCGSQRQVGWDRNLSFEASKTNTQNAPLLQEALQRGINQDPCIQTNKRLPSESVNDNEIVKGVPKMSLVNGINSLGTVSSGYGDRIGLNNGFLCERSNFKNVPQIQNPQNSNTFRSNCSNASRTASVKSPGYEDSTGQETIIKISIPHSSQNTFITLSDCGSASKSSGLPCLLNANDKFCNEWIQSSPNNAKEKSVQNVSVPQTSLNNTQTPASVPLLSPNSESGCRKNLTVPLRKRFCQVKEPFLDLNEENLNAFLNSTQLSENSKDKSISRVRDSESIARETTFQEKITLSALQLKQENAAIDSPNVTGKKKVLFEIIKREKNSIDDTETQAEPVGEGSNSVEEPLTSQVEFTEDSSVDVKVFGFSPEVPKPSPAEPVASDNSTENLNNPNDKRKEMRNKRIASEVNYKSRINRNKLDMLIQFLEMDEDSMKSTHKTAGGKSRKETDLNHNRRKLSKTSVVKNKNNSREMISMKSNKSSRVEASKGSPPAARSAKVDKDKEGRNPADADEKSEADETSSESQTKSNPPGVTHGEEDDSSAEPKNANGSAGTEMMSEGSSAKTNCDIQKAEALFKKYRTLQTSKTIFCVNCNLFSTVDLFWVNLATGELKCLNCFKKIEFESNTGNNVKTNRKEKSEITRDNTLEQSIDSDFKETYKAKCPSKCAEGISRSIRETIKQEPIDSVELSTPPRKETTVRGSNSKKERQARNSEDRSKGDVKNGKTKRRDSVPKESCSVPTKEGNTSAKTTTSVETLKKDQTTEQSLKKSISKEDHETSKKQETVRKSAQKEEEHGEEHVKKDKKCGEGSGQIRHRSESKDFVRCKSTEETSKKDARTDCEDKSIKKTKECLPALTDNSTEQAGKKSTRHEHSEKARSQSVSKENKIIHKAKESESSEESRSKSTNNSEKYKKVESIGLVRKRKNSDEDTVPVKVRIVEDQTKRDLKPVLHRISTRTALKEDIERHRTKATDTEVLSTKNSGQKVKGSSFPKDDEEHLSSSSKKKETLREDVNYHKIKAYEEAKQKARDSTEVVERKSNEEQALHKHTKNEVRQLVETFEKKKNKQDGDPHKHSSVITENKEKEKNHSSGKSESTPSRLLKENQNTKVRNEKNKDKREHKKNSHERKDKGKNGASERKDKRKLESSYDKKRLSDGSEGKSDKIQTENRHRKAFDKAAEDYLGEAQEEKHCAHLFSKLLKKTKKLSVELLGEA